MKDGVMLALVTSILWGITPIFDKLGVEKATPTAVMAIRFTTTFLCVLPLYFLSGVRTELAGLDGRTIGYIVASAVISAIFGIFLYYMAMKRMDATQVTPICATYPLITFVLGVLFLQEKLSWAKAIGTILAVIGVVIISL